MGVGGGKWLGGSSVVSTATGGPAQGAGGGGGAAPPGNGNRGIGSAAAINDEKFPRLHFAVRLGEFVDAKDLVKHDDTGAENARRTLSGGGHQGHPRCSCE